MYGELLPGQCAVQASLAQRIEAMRARAAWSRIRYFTPQQRLRAARETKSLRNLEVAQVVLAEAFAATRNEPKLALEWTSFAIQLLELIPGRKVTSDRRNARLGEAYTVHGNACRVAGDYRSARAAIEMAHELLKGSESLHLADLYSVHASLTNDIGDIEGAVALIGKGLEVYTRLRNRHGVGRLKVQHANFLREVRSAEAREIAADALLVLPRTEVRLEMIARCIISQAYAQENKGYSALSTLEEARPLISQFREAWLDGRVQFLEALILESIGHIADAERLYSEVARHFWFREMYRESFMVRLRLFEFYLGRNRFREAEEVCRKALALLSETSTHTQMKQVWRGLLETVETQALDLGILPTLRDYMARHWLVPSEYPPAIA